MIDSEQLAGVLYETYCSSVGGCAFDGKPLPDWNEFRADSRKFRQSDAWVAVAEKAVVECAIRRGESLAMARRASGFTINRREAQGPGQLVTCRTGEASGGQFALSKDGWIMLVPKGRKAGILRTYEGDDEKREEITQEFDEAAFSAMVEDWNKRKAEEGQNFPGVLIDFDHFSHDETKPTEAAGWIEDIAIREDGLWGLPRWSALGKEKLEGGIYRLVSPVLREFEEVGTEKVDGKRLLRPKVLQRLALTNDPQLRGMPPVSNRHAATAQSTNKDQVMDFKKLLCKLLGLPDTATDEEITAATDAAGAELASSRNAGCKPEEVAKMRATIAALTAAGDTARNRIEALNKELIEHDVLRFKATVTDEGKLREMLTKNREATIAALSVVKTEPSGGASGRTPMHDARNRAHPGAADADPNPGFTASEAAAIGLRAAELSATSGWGYNRAFAAATDEARMRKRAAATK